MNDYAKGVIEGLGFALILAHKNKAPKPLLRSLRELTEQVQLVSAYEKLDTLRTELQTEVRR